MRRMLLSAFVRVPAICDSDCSAPFPAQRQHVNRYYETGALFEKVTEALSVRLCASVSRSPKAMSSRTQIATKTEQPRSDAQLPKQVLG